jgi:Transposase protein
MSLCRINNAEQLKKHSPGELGKLLGLDRVPEVGYFRKKLKQIINQKKTDEFHSSLFRSWIAKMPEMFFYIDGHVRVYSGQQANLPKRYVSREKLCLSGTTEFWVNDQSGMPLMVITGELNEKLKEAIEQAIVILKEEIKKPTDDTSPWFTMVFDRESYEPKWFANLWKNHRVAIITYRKNVKDKWDDDMFKDAEIELLNNNVTMRVCELGTQLNGEWFREVRKLSEGGHQTAILTTHPNLPLHQIAGKMFSRWTQENYFKYMAENYDFDRMIEYGTETINQKRIIPNPVYRKLTQQLKKLNEKKARIEARVFRKIEGQEDKTIEQIKTDITNTSDLIDQINNYNQQINELKEQRSKEPSRVSLAELPEEKRYNKLKKESKKFKNAIVMLAYRAETALYGIIKEFFKGAENNGRMLLKEIFSSDADMIPDYQNNTLTISLHCLSTPRANEAVTKLCDFLNETETIYPYSNLKLIFKTHAV